MAERNEATFEAYDGVELRLLNGRVVRCAALTVREAVRFLRMLSEARTDPDAHATFLTEFPSRIGITGERLVDLGLEVEGCVLGELRYLDAAAIGEQVAAASYADDIAARSRAQADLLDTFPAKVGAQGLAPHEVMALGRSFVEQFYLLIYGLAGDFCSHLTASPPVKVMTLRAAEA